MSGPVLASSLVRSVCASDKLPEYDSMARFHAKFWSNEPTPNEELALPNTILDIGIPGIEPQSVLIRKDYDVIYNTCNNREDELLNEHRAPSFLIGGQAGIGKSTWLLYAAYRHASATRSFIWVKDDSHYLFASDGVFCLGSRRQQTKYPSFQQRIWVMIDQDDINQGFMAYSTTDTRNILLVTSRTHAFTERMEKTTRPSVYILNPWSREEIKKGCTIYGADSRTALERYDLFGGSPRICIQLRSQELELHAAGINSTLECLDVQQFDIMLIRTGFIPPADPSKAEFELCTLRRPRDGPLDFAKSVVPMSPYVQARMSIRFRDELDEETSLSMFHFQRRQKRMKEMAAIFFEAHVLQRFCRHILLYLNPVSQPGCEPEELDTKPTRVVRYSEDTVLDNLHTDTYYIPDVDNIRGVDSFIASQGKVYFFQFGFTINYFVSSRIIALTKRNPNHFPPSWDWRFVLILPKGHSISIPPETIVDGISLYSGLLSLD